MKDEEILEFCDVCIKYKTAHRNKIRALIKKADSINIESYNCLIFNLNRDLLFFRSVRKIISKRLNTKVESQGGTLDHNYNK